MPERPAADGHGRMLPPPADLDRADLDGADLDRAGLGRTDLDRAAPDLAALERTLTERVDGEVRFDAGSRGAYSTDGSNYRQVPIGVVVPRSVDAAVEAVAGCAEFGAPVLSRGGGTSLAGQCTNTAVVIDWTKHCDAHGSFKEAVLRCVGIGNCRTHSGGVMCPSYRATGEEEHSTRGRSRLLFEMLGGHADSPVTDGWRPTEVHDALDLCLACKGCKSDCPTGVDMATCKAEFLAHHYAHRPRPAAHYSMGWLPLWARLSRLAPRLTNALAHAPYVAGLGKRLAGVAPEREAPAFAEESFLQWWSARGLPEADPADEKTVVLWPDTFSTYFHPAVAKSAVRVLESAGFHVAVPTRAVCCGLTWISTGQLTTARRVLGPPWTCCARGSRRARPSSGSNRRAPPSSAPTPPS